MIQNPRPLQSHIYDVVVDFLILDVLKTGFPTLLVKGLYEGVFQIVLSCVRKDVQGGNLVPVLVLHLQHLLVPPGLLLLGALFECPNYCLIIDFQF